MTNRKQEAVFITIHGPVQTGKSFAANAVAAWLKEMGADVLIRKSVDQDDEPTTTKQWERDMIRNVVWVIDETH